MAWTRARPRAGEPVTAEPTSPERSSAASSSEPASGEPAADFEAALAELEEILRGLDREDLRLDEALALFERGVARLRAARTILEQARGSVEELIADAAGELRTVELETAEPAAGDDG